jgi:hypothetical protein
VAWTYSVTHVRNSEIKQLSLCFKILTWYLVCGCIMISYRSSLRFVLVQWFLVELWTLKFGQIFSCHHFILLWFEILTWFLLWECIIISYRSTLKFVPVKWFLANLQPLGFEIWPNIQLSPLYFTMIWDIDLMFGMRVYSHKLQINFEIHSGWMIFGQLAPIGLWNLAKYLVVSTFFFTMIWDIDLNKSCEFKEAWGYRS